MKKREGLKECPYCSKDLSEVKGANRANHTRWCDKNPKHAAYMIKAQEIGLRPITDYERINRSERMKAAYAAGKFDNVIRKGFVGKHSDETRALMSEKKKEWCLNNKEKHNWSLRHRKSIPCEKLKEKLRAENISFEEEYMPLSDRLFQVDIAFPELKIGIEINGNQHYEEGKLKPYYQERHDLIVAAGWELHEFHYAKAFGQDIVDFIKEKI